MPWGPQTLPLPSTYPPTSYLAPWKLLAQPPKLWQCQPLAQVKAGNERSLRGGWGRAWSDPPKTFLQSSTGSESRPACPRPTPAFSAFANRITKELKHVKMPFSRSRLLLVLVNSSNIDWARDCHTLTCFNHLRSLFLSSTLKEPDSVGGTGKLHFKQGVTGNSHTSGNMILS